MSQQYRQPTNLQARIGLHDLYKTNPYDWFKWVFDHFPAVQPAHILEPVAAQEGSGKQT